MHHCFGAVWNSRWKMPLVHARAWRLVAHSAAMSAWHDAHAPASTSSGAVVPTSIGSTPPMPRTCHIGREAVDGSVVVPGVVCVAGPQPATTAAIASAAAFTSVLGRGRDPLALAQERHAAGDHRLAVLVGPAVAVDQPIGD